MKLSMIAAVNEDNVIGKKGNLPWHIPEDLEYFKQITMGKPIVMGRKTFESIGRVLPGRIHIVLTRDDDWTHPGVLVARNMQHALAIVSDVPEVIIIGGQQVYTEALPYVSKLYLTEVQAKVEDPDAFFPPFNKNKWRATKLTMPAKPQKIPYRFIVYERP